MLSTKKLHIFQNEKQALIDFHGHSCRGLAIGIRLVSFAQDILQYTKDNLIVVTESDMCAVDAIQFLCSCTYGKGNLIHKDYGKNAFTFYDTKQEKAIRILLKSDISLLIKEEIANNSNQEIQKILKEDALNIMYLLNDQDLFSYEEVEYTPPRKAQVLQSFKCDICHEYMMESRARHYAGKTMCIPCFIQYEQKI